MKSECVHLPVSIKWIELVDKHFRVDLKPRIAAYRKVADAAMEAALNGFVPKEPHDRISSCYLTKDDFGLMQAAVKKSGVKTEDFTQSEIVMMAIGLAVEAKKRGLV